MQRAYAVKQTRTMQCAYAINGPEPCSVHMQLRQTTIMQRAYAMKTDLNRAACICRLMVGSGMATGEWTGSGKWQEVAEAAMEIPSTLQQIESNDLTKIKELGRGQFGSVWLCRWPVQLPCMSGNSFCARHFVSAGPHSRIVSRLSQWRLMSVHLSIYDQAQLQVTD